MTKEQVLRVIVEHPFEGWAYWRSNRLVHSSMCYCGWSDDDPYLTTVESRNAWAEHVWQLIQEEEDQP